MKTATEKRFEMEDSYSLVYAEDNREFVEHKRSFIRFYLDTKVWETYEERNARWAVERKEQQDKETAERKEIKKFANHHMYTDVDPYEVIRTISPICVEIREMKTTQTSFPKEFYPGGFIGNFADNRGGQDYTYESDETNPTKRIRFSRAKGNWFDANNGRFHMSDAPYKFYDYNF